MEIIVGRVPKFNSQNGYDKQKDLLMMEKYEDFLMQRHTNCNIPEERVR